MGILGNEIKPITLKDVGDFKINTLTFRESLELKRMTKNMNTFEFCGAFLEKVTTLDDEQIYSLVIQDIYSIMLEYLLEQFDNPLISDTLTVKDFLSQEPNYEEEIFKIGDFRFTNMITLHKAIECEKYCYLKRDVEFLSMYIMAGSCLKGIPQGVETLLNTNDTSEHRNNILTLNKLIGQVSHTQIDLLVDLKNVSIITGNSYLPLDTNLFFF
jgi:hypothetical protein